MRQQTADPHDTETSSSDIGERHIELAGQHWNRAKSALLAEDEGVDLSDAHWAVILSLRADYLKHGLSSNARTTARMLDSQFAGQGGNKYLRRLFKGGPVTQGSRLASLRTPAYAADPSFGTSY
jgi:tRNA 2-thiouridine synthesizing protein E